MPSTRTVFCRKELREKVEAILYRSKSQRTRTDFQSVATFMIVLIMKLHNAEFKNVFRYVDVVDFTLTCQI